MNRKLFLYSISGIIFVIILGSLSHFFYEWSNQNSFVGLFSPVNESIWEHIKLLFFPMLLWIAFMTLRLSKEFPCLLSGFSAGLLLGTYLIPVLFFSYSGILGKHYTFIDILIFLLCTIIAFFLGYRFTLNCHFQKRTRLFLFFVFLLAVCFMAFTYSPPNLGIFQAL